MWVEANTPNDANIRNKPDLFQGTVTNHGTGAVGKVFKYVVEAFNAVGSTKGITSSYILAIPPAAPTSAPADLASMTSSTQITVTLTALTGDSQTGGAPILSYHLHQSTNGPNEPANFVDIAGSQVDSLAL